MPPLGCPDVRLLPGLRRASRHAVALALRASVTAAPFLLVTLPADAIRKSITSGFFYHTASLQKNGSYRTVKNPQARLLACLGLKSV